MMNKEQVLKILSKIQIGIVEIDYVSKDLIQNVIMFEIFNGKITKICDEVENKFNKGYSTKELQNFILMGYQHDMKNGNAKVKWRTFDEYYDINKEIEFKNITILIS